MPPPPPPAERGLVALLTDFGCGGHHAGVLRGVLLGIAPRARVVDLTHGVPAGDVVLAAWTLRWSWRWFPPGSVFCAVVDPGVGSARRALAAAAGGRFFVGPDNGLLSFALRDAGGPRAVALETPAGAAPTFHGRDLFAPAAARLARGESLAALGPRVDDWHRLAEPAVRRLGAGALAGEVIAVDRWGNLVTSLTRRELEAAGCGRDAVVRVGRRAVRGVHRTYADVPAGEAVALVNSDGHLEVAVNGGRADETLRARRGTTVRVEIGPRR